MDQYTEGMECHWKKNSGGHYFENNRDKICSKPATHHVEGASELGHGFVCLEHAEQYKKDDKHPTAKRVRIETVEEYIVRCTEATFKRKPVIVTERLQGISPEQFNISDDPWTGGWG